VAGLGSGVSVAVTVTGGTYSKNGGGLRFLCGDSAKRRYLCRSPHLVCKQFHGDQYHADDRRGERYLYVNHPSGLRPPPDYDTRFGVTNTTTGWIDFPLQGSAKRIWLDQVSGNDANNGLSAATAKKTFDAAIVLYKSGHSPSDQLMIAGASGGTGTGPTYTDGGIDGDGIRGLSSGVSLTYPNAFLCYDPASPADSTKYGKLLGGAKPSLTVPASDPAINMPGSTGSSNVAVQGIDFDAAGNHDRVMGFSGSGGAGLAHYGICFQNCRFKGVRLTLICGNNDPETGPYGQNYLISKCSGWGQWSTGGNMSWLFVEGTDGYCEQETVGGHCAWKIGASRDDDISIGGPLTLGHGRYFSAQSLNGRSDWTVWFDSAVDGDNTRGEMAMTYSVHLNEPTVGTTGGYSSSVAEAPLGELITRSCGLVVGGGDYRTGSFYSNAWGNQMTKPGSFIEDYLLVANPKVASGYNIPILNPANNPDMIEQFITMRRITGFNYSNRLRHDEGSSPERINVTWVDCNLDQLAPGTGNTVSSSGDFPTPWTSINDLVSAMGFASLAAMYNMMLYRPDLPWARAMVTAAFTAHGKTQTLAGVSPPTPFTPDLTIY
jgi:hypothetical protein